MMCLCMLGGMKLYPFSDVGGNLQLIIYFLLNVDYLNPDDDDDDADYLNPIKFTKLYWFLLRCLTPVPTERSYVYI